MTAEDFTTLKINGNVIESSDDDDVPLAKRSVAAASAPIVDVKQAFTKPAAPEVKANAPILQNGAAAQAPAAPAHVANAAADDDSEDDLPLAARATTKPAPAAKPAPKRPALDEAVALPSVPRPKPRPAPAPAPKPAVKRELVISEDDEEDLPLSKRRKSLTGGTLCAAAAVGRRVARLCAVLLVPSCEPSNDP
jgi:hypothetical protein